MEASKTTEVQVHSFDNLVKVGAEMAEKPPITPPSPDDLAVVCYTSGTTGDPKGEGPMAMQDSRIDVCLSILLNKYRELKIIYNE